MGTGALHGLDSGTRALSGFNSGTGVNTGAGLGARMRDENSLFLLILGEFGDSLASASGQSY